MPGAARLVAAERSASDHNRPQRTALAERGLTVSGSFAVLPQELELRKRLEALEAAIKRTTAARAQVDAQLHAQ